MSYTQKTQWKQALETINLKFYKFINLKRFFSRQNLAYQFEMTVRIRKLCIFSLYSSCSPSRVHQYHIIFSLLRASFIRITLIHLKSPNIFDFPMNFVWCEYQLIIHLIGCIFSQFYSHVQCKLGKSIEFQELDCEIEADAAWKLN